MRSSKTKFRHSFGEIRFTEREIIIMTLLFENAKKGNESSDISYMEFMTSKYWVDRLLELINYVPAGKLYLNLLNIVDKRKKEIEKNKQKGR